VIKSHSWELQRKLKIVGKNPKLYKPSHFYQRQACEVVLDISLGLTAVAAIVWILLANGIARRLNQRSAVFGEVGGFVIFLGVMLAILLMVRPT